MVSKGGAHVVYVFPRCFRGTLGNPTSTPLSPDCGRDSAVSHFPARLHSHG